MKQNKTAVFHIIACFIAAATLAGCTWDSSLYDEFVNKNSDTVTSCPGRLGITLPNGVYAYQDGRNSNTYYCGTYDKIGKNPNILDDIMCENYINANNKSGFSSYEEFKDYFNHMTSLFAEDGSPICPGNTESCSTLYVRISTQQTPTLKHITFCNACPEGTAMDNSGTCAPITPTITCDTATSHYYNGECIPNDLANCGKHNHNCKNILGWENGTCENATCIPSSCTKSYHLDNGSCVADDNNNCGRVGQTCGKGQVCTQGKCSDNCGSGEVRCEKDNNVSCADPMTNTTFCGANDTCSDGSYETCADGQACVGGFCKQNTCTNDAETLCVVNDQNTCIALDSDNPDHCGACNLKCSDRSIANASSTTCVDGKCQYTCEEGYENCGTATVPNCLNQANFQNDPNNCGGCGNQDTKYICNQDAYCSNGTCQKSTCTNACLSNGTCVNRNDACGTQCINCNSANYAASGTCTDKGVCTITSCITGYHLTESKTCALNTPTACGSAAKTGVSNCMDKSRTHATDAYCNANGQCVATSCETGYHVVKGECVKDSQTACGASATDCTKLIGWNAGKCENGQCKATACQPSYCLNATTCVDGAYNARMCGITGEACLPCDIASGKSCVNGQCVQSRCDENVCFYQGSECSNTNDHCGATCTDCEMIKNAENATCTSDTGLCEITMCQPGYHIKKAAGKHDTCEQNTSDKCAEPSSNDTKKCADELQVSDDTKHIQTVDCSPEGTCMITECSPGYHVNDENSACVEDSTTACGATLTDCTTLEGVMITEENAVQCLNGKCNATACLKDYHLAGEDNEKKCVQDSPTVCGDSQTNCHEIAHAYEPICRLGTCYVIECEDGYATNDEHNACVCDEGACQADKFPWVESAACNADKTACLLSCPADQHLSPDKTDCVDNTDEACAPQDANTPVDCTDIDESTHIANRTCQSGACKITTCQSGYHIATEEGLTCEANSPTACAPVNSSATQSCANPNPKCGDAGECCRENDSSNPSLTSKPNCCNNNCKKRNSQGKTYYRCSNSTSGGWSAC